MKLKNILILLFIIIYSINKSQNVEALVSSKQVQIGVPFEYAIVIKINANTYTPPNFKDFDIVGGPNQSNSSQWVNGVTSSQLTLTWFLVAKKEGKCVIGQATVISGNQKFETNTIELEVSKNGNYQKQTNSNQDDTKYNKISGEDLFIRTGLNKDKCFIGEEVIITQKVFSRNQIVGFQKFNPPTYNGFYSQSQESLNKGQVSTENINGINYYTYELFRNVCIANKTGKNTINSIDGDVVIRRQTTAKPRNIFEQFFGASSFEDIPINCKSRPVSIEVLDLPDKDKPANFNGAVGKFTFKIETTRSELLVNDAFNLKIIINGRGNLKLIDAPKLDLPESFEIYDPKITENESTKIFDYILIPRVEGLFTLSNFNFSYFDLSQKKYVFLSANDLKIKVLPGDPNNKKIDNNNPKNQIKQSENDIRYIKRGEQILSEKDYDFFNSPSHIFLLLLSLIFLATALIIRKKYIQINSNIVNVKHRKASKIAKKQLIFAEKLMILNKKEEFYTEILNALNNYIGNKLNIPISDLSKETLNTALINKKIENDIITKLNETIENSEYAKYAPGKISGNLKLVYSDTIYLISELEQSLNKKNT